MNKNIRVSWIKKYHIISPEEYTSNPTEEDYKYYFEAIEKAKNNKITGTILDFNKSFLFGTKAIIKGDDNKIYTININELTVIEDVKE